MAKKKTHHTLFGIYWDKNVHKCPSLLTLQVLYKHLNAAVMRKWIVLVANNALKNLRHCRQWFFFFKSTMLFTGKFGCYECNIKKKPKIKSALMSISNVTASFTDAYKPVSCWIQFFGKLWMTKTSLLIKRNQEYLVLEYIEYFLLLNNNLFFSIMDWKLDWGKYCIGKLDWGKYRNIGRLL